jgi:hypothetical protein
VPAERGDVRLAFCWAHVRRRFYELAAAVPAPIASEALERIAGLEAIESESVAAAPRKGAPPGRAEAIRYALSRWEGLTLFLDDGRI